MGDDRSMAITIIGLQTARVLLLRRSLLHAPTLSSSKRKNMHCCNHQKRKNEAHFRPESRLTPLFGFFISVSVQLLVIYIHWQPFFTVTFSALKFLHLFPLRILAQFLLTVPSCRCMIGRSKKPDLLDCW